MRTPKVNKEEVKNQLLKGISPEAIAKYQGCARQYISDIKRQYERKGVVFPTTRPGRKPQKVEAKPLIDTTMEDQVELTIQAFEALKRQPELEAERDKYRRGYENLKEQFELTEKDKTKRIRQQQRWELAKQKPNIAEV